MNWFSKPKYLSSRYCIHEALLAKCDEVNNTFRHTTLFENCRLARNWKEKIGRRSQQVNFLSPESIYKSGADHPRKVSGHTGTLALRLKKKFVELDLLEVFKRPQQKNFNEPNMHGNSSNIF